MPPAVRTCTATARRVLAALALAVGGVLAVPAGADDAPSEFQRLPDMGGPASGALPVARERDLGDRMMREVRRHLSLVDDPEVHHYVQDLGHRLVAHAENPGFSFNFFVVDRPEINAFAMPGGHIGLHAGLIRETESESELGGVVAHEIAHVTQRHIARNYAQAQRLNLQTAAAILAAILVGSQDAQAGSAAAMAGIAAPIQQQLSYSREFEREADRVGLRIMTAGGLDPYGMPRFFERLDEASRHAEQPPEYLSTHPLTRQRLTETRGIADRYAGGDVFESGDHPYIRARLQVRHEDTAGQAVARMRDELRRAEDPSQRHGALYGLALALGRDGRFEEARSVLDGLEQQQGERLLVLLARAEIEREADRLEEALAAYERAGDIYPTHPARLHRHGETLLMADRPGEARELLAPHTRRNGRHPELLRLLAEAAHNSGRETEGHLALARYYHARGEFNHAMRQLDQAINAGDEDRFRKAQAEALRDRWQEDLERRPER